jgi:hypothetical protein
MKLSSQPLLGIIASLLVVSASLWISVTLSPDAVLTWVSLILVAMVPMQMVIGLAWRSQQPAFIAALPQPIRGLAFTALMSLAGGIVAFIANAKVGGGMLPPTPFVNMFMIFAVPMTISLIIVFQCWPFSVIFRDKPVAMGFALVIAAYALAWLVFEWLFNFSFLAHAPFYQAALDPKGLFMAWLPLAAGLSCVVGVLCLVLLDFWPVKLIVNAVPALARQPWFGLLATVFVAAIAKGLWWFFDVPHGMDVVAFLVQVNVAMVFGIFIVLVMFEGAPFIRLPQPIRGLVLIAVAAALAIGLHALYQAIAVQKFGLPRGAPTYALELWLATSMLAITFPLMVAFASFFDFWPLRLGEGISSGH